MTVSRGQNGMIHMAFLVLSILLCSSLIRVSEAAVVCPHGGKPGEECKANENGIVDLDDDFDDTYKIVNHIAIQPPSPPSATPIRGGFMGDGGAGTEIKVEGH